jgi:hypothetical protein
MEHVKNFDEFLADENPNSDPKKKPETGAAEEPNTESPKADAADSEDATKTEVKPEAPNVESPKDAASDAADDTKAEEKPSETPASDAADDTNKEVEDDTEVTEGNAFTGALAKAKEAGLKEFEFNGKKYKVNEAKDVASFEDFINENFALYPGFSNMIGSEVMRNVPFTHDVNMAVFGKPYIVDGYGADQTVGQSADATVTVTVKEEEHLGETQSKCSNCGCVVDTKEVEQDPTKICTECQGTTWEAM